MKYSRKCIDKAGFALIGGDPFERQQASSIVTDWRQLHLPVLRKLNDELTELLVSSGIPFEFSSHRIKRMQSIVEKLRNNREKKMGLGGLHDIGGIRFVFPNIDILQKAKDVIKSHVFSGFILKTKDDDYDYVTYPKESGYRSIHLVYKHESDDKDYDGLQIELQIRTKLQHCWAMAVETASLISGASLKASLQDGSVWRDFFKLISAIFSNKEGTPLHDNFTQYSSWDFCREYNNYIEEHKLVDQLRALRVSVNFDKHKEIEDGYCVLVVDFQQQMVYFKYFDSEDEAKASEEFTNMEKGLTDNEAALMVSMAKMSELRKAYPSYFLDTEDFLLTLKEFDLSCLRQYSSLLPPPYKWNI